MSRSGSVWKALILVGSGLFFTTLLPASELRFSALAQASYQALVRQDTTTAHQLLRRLAEQEPQNAIGEYLAHLRDFLAVLLRGDPVAARRFSTQADHRLSRLKSSAVTSPWREYCLGEMYLMDGVLAFRRGNWWSSAWSFRQGFMALTSSEADFPHFLPTQKDLLLLRAALATVPERFRWALEWFSGLEGDYATLAEKQTQLVETLLRQHHFLALDAGVFQVLTLRELMDAPDRAAALQQRLGGFFPDHPILIYLEVQLALDAGQVNQARQILGSAAGKRAMVAIPYLIYHRGRAELLQLDTRAAENSLSMYLKLWSGQIQRAEAEQKRGWCALLEGDTVRYRAAMRRIQALPDSPLEGDGQARLEAQSGRIPQPQLLRARLLFDGHQFVACQQVLEDMDPKHLPRAEDRLEWRYRKARVHQSLGRWSEALQGFQAVWKAGQGGESHVVAASALQAGEINRQYGQDQSAEIWYRRCLAERPDRYRYGLHQAARAGLQRLDTRQIEGR